MTMPFITTDGRGAELQVKPGYGSIASISAKPDKNTAEVVFKVENLKFPVKGWVKLDDPLFPKIEAYQKSGEQINFRLESQRKANIDATIPYAELKEQAATNLISKAVFFNGEYTTEALSRVENDPVQGAIPQSVGQPAAGAASAPVAAAVSGSDILDAIRAAVAGGFSPEVVDALTAQALVAGVDAAVIHEARSADDRRTDAKPDEVWANFSTEAPSWSAYNKDGRVNLGSLNVTAGVGAEKFVRNALGSATSAQTVRSFADLILAIGDLVQERAYGSGFRADRGASSHGTIRGIIYDTISNVEGAAIPAGADTNAVKAWVGLVATTVRDRFALAVEISENRRSFADIYANLNTGETVNPKQGVAQEAPAQRTAPAPQQGSPVATPVVEAKSAETAAPEVVSEAPAAPAEKSKSATADATTLGIKGLSKGVPSTVKAQPKEVNFDVSPDIEYDEDAAEETVSVSAGFDAADEDEDFFPYEINIAEAIAEEEIGADLASAATQKEFNSFVAQSQLDKADFYKVSNLLKWTFGEEYGKIKDIPNDALAGFIDHYNATGVENFLKAIEKANS